MISTDSPAPTAPVATSTPGPAGPPDDGATEAMAVASATDAVTTLRQQIDAVDAAIAQLVAERATLSRRVQATRMSAGGTRFELGRERKILASYRAVLGADGAHLADAILQVCRGRR